jgi:hypothetical protein
MKLLESADEELNRSAVPTDLSMPEKEFVAPQFKKRSSEENPAYLKQVNEFSPRYAGT